jgi:hypothetical protein
METTIIRVQSHPADVYHGKVWYGPRDKKAAKSPGFSTWEAARRWIFSQPKTGRFKATRQSTILKNGTLFTTCSD